MCLPGSVFELSSAAVQLQCPKVQGIEDTVCSQASFWFLCGTEVHVHSGMELSLSESHTGWLLKAGSRSTAGSVWQQLLACRGFWP